MTKWSKDYSIDKAISLATENMKSANEWVSASEVIDFIDAVYSYLSGDESSLNSE